eukprot:CAMPEP_0181202550 /NCGR_PEP_ID=MMETSP1096-20121128/18907_1 /TAXON_ID=156174 ORGANISM="Chrysochromulina ericina, Strain CCMP281" /NCGR_SAMPLE_ID=MMETSP1096 /ASSEMBLY_ACC=CAM_ASM_000453 /LENGTH=212 /DNA_ID=CAMNT_0023293081 /DNA_START=9 /DNA_END=647 /DNA_ORIENTATION=+
MKFMFETMEYTHFGYNPFIKAGDNMYRKESTDGKNGMGSTLAFYVRSEMGEYAAAYGGSADRCNRNTNGHKHGSSICFNSFKGDKTLAMNGNLNSQSTWGPYLCNVNGWCGGGNKEHLMMMLVAEMPAGFKRTSTRYCEEHTSLTSETSRYYTSLIKCQTDCLADGNCGGCNFLCSLNYYFSKGSVAYFRFDKDKCTMKESQCGSYIYTKSG